MNTGLLLQWSQTGAPSGAEGLLAQQLQKEIEPYVDEVFTDVLGNLIARKKGTKPQSGTLMLAASMDERGVMAIHAEENGFLRIVPIGTWEPAQLVGHRVRFANGTRGIVGAENTAGNGELTFSDLFVDIGASDGEEALKQVPLGETATVEHLSAERIGDRIIGHLESRVGCFVAVEIIKRLDRLESDLSIVFSVQKQVGSRGIKTAAFRVDPDFALLIGTAATGDTPGAERSDVRLGGGPALKILDGSIIVPADVRRRIQTCASLLGIPVQAEILPKHKSDAGAIQLARGGIPTAALSVPLRYPQSFTQVVSLVDLENTIQLGTEVLKQALP
jgi:putative aminopeptidase FrvX